MMATQKNKNKNKNKLSPFINDNVRKEQKIGNVNMKFFTVSD